MALIELCGKYASTAVKKVRGGGFLQATPLHKWRRNDGLASFLRDMIALRKTLSLCRSCEAKMPSRWQSRYTYELVKELSADDCPCDYCRQVTSVNLFVAGEGAYFAEYDLGRRSVSATTERERKLRDKDWRHVLTF